MSKHNIKQNANKAATALAAVMAMPNGLADTSHNRKIVESNEQARKANEAPANEAPASMASAAIEKALANVNAGMTQDGMSDDKAPAIGAPASMPNGDVFGQKTSTNAHYINKRLAEAGTNGVSMKALAGELVRLFGTRDEVSATSRVQAHINNVLRKKPHLGTLKREAGLYVWQFNDGVTLFDAPPKQATPNEQAPADKA